MYIVNYYYNPYDGTDFTIEILKNGTRISDLHSTFNNRADNIDILNILRELEGLKFKLNTQEMNLPK